jgi:hypothetical protein
VVVSAQVPAAVNHSDSDVVTCHATGGTNSVAIDGIGAGSVVELIEDLRRIVVRRVAIPQGVNAPDIKPWVEVRTLSPTASR